MDGQGKNLHDLTLHAPRPRTPRIHRTAHGGRARSPACGGACPAPPPRPASDRCRLFPGGAAPPDRARGRCPHHPRHPLPPRRRLVPPRRGDLCRRAGRPRLAAGRTTPCVWNGGRPLDDSLGAFYRGRSARVGPPARPRSHRPGGHSPPPRRPPGGDRARPRLCGDRARILPPPASDGGRGPPPIVVGGGPARDRADGFPLRAGPRARVGRGVAPRLAAAHGASSSSRRPRGCR
jgi:hypothetical protein